MKLWKQIVLILLIVVLPVVAYVIMHGPVAALALARGDGLARLLVTLFVIALGLGVPYWMLKPGMHEANRSDAGGKESSRGV